MKKKRERLEVINDILLVIRNNNNSIRPTKLLRMSNLSPQMFKEYVDELITKEFIEETSDKGNKTYTITSKGFEFLNYYKTVTEFIKNLGL